MGQIFAVADGCVYGWVSEFIPELSGHWILVSRSSGLFRVWITLKLFYGILHWETGSGAGLWLSLR